MATYKVIQDIEAEDKLLGPLSFRQFIYGLVAAFCFYLSFIVITKGAAFLAIIFLPPGLIGAFFAFPFGKDQPTEVWALAKIRFMFKPQRRIWDQSGVKELVTITAPKKIEEVRTDGLSQNEIKSRLSALANTIDSRGWAVKNVNLNLSAQMADPSLDSSDRLVDVNGLPQEVSSSDIVAADDILDEQNNPIAHQFDQMITASTQAHREQLMAMMKNPAPAPTSATLPPPQVSAAPIDTPQPNYWFLNQPVEAPQLAPNQATFAAPQVINGAAPVAAQPGMVQAAEPTAAEEAFAEQLVAQHAKPAPVYGHLKTIQPLGMQPDPVAAAMPNPALPVTQPAMPSVQLPAAQMPAQSSAATPAEPVTPQPNPAILELANNNDLNVATLARQAHKAEPELGEEEVVIALH